MAQTPAQKKAAAKLKADGAAALARAQSQSALDVAEKAKVATMRDAAQKTVPSSRLDTSTLAGIAKASGSGSGNGSGSGSGNSSGNGSGSGENKQPGKAWVTDGKGGWIKPQQPADGKTYTWDDENGWVTGTSTLKATETGRVTNADGSTTITSSDGSTQIIPFNSGLGGTGKVTDLSAGTATDIFLKGLSAMGLGSLAKGVQGLVNQGIHAEGIAAWVRSQPEYATRFPGMAALNASGQGVSEAAYMQKEDTDRSILYTYLGPNAQSYDNYATLGKLVTGFKSSVELQSNLQAYHDAVNSSPETKAWLKSTYGLTDQDLVAYWLNPKTAGDEIQLRMNSSNIGGRHYKQDLAILLKPKPRL